MQIHTFLFCFVSFNVFNLLSKTYFYRKTWARWNLNCGFLSSHSNSTAIVPFHCSWAWEHWIKPVCVIHSKGHRFSYNLYNIQIIVWDCCISNFITIYVKFLTKNIIMIRVDFYFGKMIFGCLSHTGKKLQVIFKAMTCCGNLYKSNVIFNSAEIIELSPIDLTQTVMRHDIHSVAYAVRWC